MGGGRSSDSLRALGAEPPRLRLRGLHAVAARLAPEDPPPIPSAATGAGRGVGLRPLGARYM